MSQNPKDQAKVLCYWDQDQPGGEASAICIYQNDGFYLDGELQISPTWWEYLDEFDTPNDAKLRSIIRDLRDDLRRRKDGKINRTQYCAECERLAKRVKELEHHVKSRGLAIDSLKERFDQANDARIALEAVVKRWEPRPISEAPKDGSPFWAVYEHGCGELTITRVCARADGVIFGGYPKMEIPMRIDFICWLPIPTAEELKQIGGGK